MSDFKVQGRLFDNGFRIIKRMPNSIYIFIVVFLGLSISVNNFFSATNLSTLLEQTCILSLLSVAMSLAIISAGIDLSVGGIVSFAGIIMALLISSGVNTFFSVIIGVFAAMIFGLLNGLIVVKMKVVPFIATFGMMGVAQGIANLLSNKRAIYLNEDNGNTVIQFLQNKLIEINIGDGIFSINMIVIITILSIALIIFLYKKTQMGLYLYAIGGNKEAAKLSHIRVDIWNIGVYVITGLIAGVAALLMVLRLNSAQPTAGDGLEFQAVVAAVLGGNDLKGGRGSIAGAILGAFSVYALKNGLALAGVNSFLIMIILGAVLIIGMVLNTLASNHNFSKKHITRGKE